MLLGRLEFLEFISQSLKTVCFHKETRKKEIKIKENNTFLGFRKESYLVSNNALNIMNLAHGDVNLSLFGIFFEKYDFFEYLLYASSCVGCFYLYPCNFCDSSQN